LIVSTLLIASILWLGREPNTQLQFDRTVPVQISEDTLKRALTEVPFWNRWFHYAGKVERIDLTGAPMPGPDQVVEKGAWMRILIDPKKGEKRKFFLTVEVTDYQPNQKISFQLKEDQSGKWQRLFSEMTWSLEVLPKTDKLPLRLHGTAVATTRSFRARFWGRLSEKILMNQIYLPDLISLAEFTLEPKEVPPTAY
jgi:hypothetical protein